MEFERGLWSLVLFGQPDEVEDRLRKGVDVNIKDQSGYSPLHYAARRGDLGICQLLLKYSAQVDATTKAGQATPLHRASFMGHSDVVRLLLDHGADPLCLDSDGMTALHKAIEGGHAGTAIILLTAAPQCKSVQDARGRLPADLSVDAGLIELLR